MRKGLHKFLSKIPKRFEFGKVETTAWEILSGSIKKMERLRQVLTIDPKEESDLKWVDK